MDTPRYQWYVTVGTTNEVQLSLSSLNWRVGICIRDSTANLVVTIKRSGFAMPDSIAPILLWNDEL